MQSFLSMSVFIFDEFLIFDLENHIAVKVDQKVPQKKIFQNAAQKRKVPRKRIEFFSYCDFFVFFQTLIIYGWRVKYVGAIQDGKQDDLELRRISRKKTKGGQEI